MVRTYRGARGSSPSFERTCAMCTSTTWSSPNQSPPPHTLEQLLAAEDDARLPREDIEQVELDLRQLDRLAATTDLARRGVDLQIAEPPEGGGLIPIDAQPAQHRSHAGHQLAGRERLGDVVVGARGQAHDPVDLLDPRREHHDVSVAEAADLPARLDPVDPREHQVEHDHTRVELARELDRALAVAGGRDLEPLAREIARDELHQRRLVVDDQRTQTGGPWPAGQRWIVRSVHADLAMNAPCHQCGQTAPVVALTETIPVILPPLSISRV